jgi:hypothetical protein
LATLPPQATPLPSPLSDDNGKNQTWKAYLGNYFSQLSHSHAPPFHLTNSLAPCSPLQLQMQQPAIFFLTMPNEKRLIISALFLVPESYSLASAYTTLCHFCRHLTLFLLCRWRLIVP